MSSSAGGPFERPLASTDSWKALRVDSRQGGQEATPAAFEPAEAPEAPPPAEQSAEAASKAAEGAGGAADASEASPPPPPPDAGEQAPPADIPAALIDAPAEQPRGEQQVAAAVHQEETAPQQAAPAAEGQAAELGDTQLPDPAQQDVQQAAAEVHTATQDAPSSTASSAEEEQQSAPPPGTHRRHSHKGGPRGPRRKPPPPHGEGPTSCEAVEPPAGEEGGEEGGGILAELEAHRRQQKQLVVEGKVRQELESMLQRIEGHFRTEQAARRRTEEALALAAGERDALRGQLEAERMQQAALLQQAMQERGMLEAQLAAISAELEQTRQESAARLEAMAAEVAAWRASAEGVARQAEQARRELADRAAEIEGASVKIRSLAELLATPGSPTATQDSFLVSHAGASPGTGRQAGLQFQRAPGGSGGSGGKAKSKLPYLKTRAVPGATLRQPGGEGSSPGGSPTISALPSLSPGSRGLQRERSTGGGVAWAASGKADRSAESQRDHARTAHMARWNNA